MLLKYVNIIFIHSFDTTKINGIMCNKYKHIDNNIIYTRDVSGCIVAYKNDNIPPTNNVAMANHSY